METSALQKLFSPSYPKCSSPVNKVTQRSSLPVSEPTTPLIASAPPLSKGGEPRCYLLLYKNQITSCREKSFPRMTKDQMTKDQNGLVMNVLLNFLDLFLIQSFLK